MHLGRWRRPAIVVAGAVLALMVIPATGQSGEGTALQPVPDGFGPVIVAEQGADRVVRIEPDLEVEVLAEDLPAPRGVAVSPDGSTLAVAVTGAGPGEGRIDLIDDAGHRTLLDGLTFPEGVGFFDDETLVWTGFTESTINVIDLGDGSSRVGAVLEANPTGVTRVEHLGATTMAVSSWEGPAVRFDPVTDFVGPITPALSGGGHPAFDSDLGLCVPEFMDDVVTCFPLGGGDPFQFGPVVQPVAVTFNDGGLLLVSGPEGLTVIDPDTGERLGVFGLLDNPAGITVLGTEGEDTVVVTTTSPATTTSSSTTTTTTVAPTTTAALPPGASEEVDDEGGGFPWWWGVVSAIVALAAGLVVWRREDIFGVTAAAYPDPCEEICRRAAAARRQAEQAASEAEQAQQEADEARDEADRAGEAADEARREADSAETDADRAADAHRRAQAPPAHSGGYAASGGVEYTGADHDRVEAERDHIDDQVESGEMSQAEAQEAKGELRDPAKWEELEERERQEHAERVREAEQRAEEARQRAEEARKEAEAQRDEARSAEEQAAAAEKAAADAKQAAQEAEQAAAEAEEACRKCLGEAAIAAAGGPESWITREGGVGGPCPEGAQAEEVTRTERFLVFDESRQVVVEDAGLRPERISEEAVTGIRRVLQVIAGAINVGTKVPGTGLTMAGRIALSYGGFIAMGAAKVLSSLQEAVQTAQRAGGVSDYWFVRVTVPRTEITVTCTCTIECRHGVWTCTGCTVSEKRRPADSVEESEGTRAEVERFLAGMQARAKAAKEAQQAHAAAVDACGCG